MDVRADGDIAENFWWRRTTLTRRTPLYDACVSAGLLVAATIVGALLGSGVAQLIGRVVFGSGITMRPMVFVLVFVLLAVTVLLASASSIRSILNLKPAEVLHGR